MLHSFGRRCAGYNENGTRKQRQGKKAIKKANLAGPIIQPPLKGG
jgi:hypothetical protein